MVQIFVQIISLFRELLQDVLANFSSLPKHGDRHFYSAPLPTFKKLPTALIISVLVLTGVNGKMVIS